MDYIIYRGNREWMRWDDGQVFLTGDRYEIEHELKIEKTSGCPEAMIISLRYTITDKQCCTPYVGRTKLCDGFEYDDAMDDFYEELEAQMFEWEKILDSKFKSDF